MLNFKVLALIALVTPAVFTLGSEVQVNNEEPQMAVTEEADFKINWGPVWDDQQGHHEFVVKTIEESEEESKVQEVNEEPQVPVTQEAFSKINWGPVWDDQQGHHEFVVKTTQDSEEDHQNCNAPNGLGLQNLFKQVKEILPKEQIKAIVKSYAQDPEVKALKSFMLNLQTKAKINIIRNSQEYQILKNYACHILHIDLNQYHQLARTFIQTSLVRVAERKGIRGLISEVDAILPRTQLRELYKNLLSSDEELVKAVEHLKSEEFHQLLLNVRNNVPEYKELTKQLSALGVPVEEMRELLANTLGWAPEMGVFV